MKKIVFFTQNLKCGGVQKSVSFLAESLKKEFEVIIILLESNQKYFYKVEDIQIIEIKTKKVDINKKNIGIELFNYRVNELNKLLKKTCPDLVISYEDYHNLILLNTQNKCKKIISVRNSIFNLYKKNEKIHLLDSSFYLDNIKNNYFKADKIITVSDYINKELKQLCNLDNIKTIHNGVSKKSIIEDYKFKKPYILNVARINKRKGHIDLVKAFDMIKNEISHDLIIVGDGVERKKIENLIEKLGLKHRIKLVGTQSPYKYIQNCELFVFPSKSEGFSNSVLEVMSAKKNIVAYKYNGAEEVLPEENLVKINDINSLASKIVYFLKNKEKNNKCSEKLFNISKSFSFEKTLLTYTKEIYKLCVE